MAKYRYIYRYIYAYMRVYRQSSRLGPNCMFSHMFYKLKLLFAIERGAIQCKWRRHRFLAFKQRLARPGSRTGERAHVSRHFPYVLHRRRGLSRRILLDFYCLFCLCNHDFLWLFLWVFLLGFLWIFTAFLLAALSLGYMYGLGLAAGSLLLERGIL